MSIQGNQADHWLSAPGIRARGGALHASTHPGAPTQA
jgi:hypothetical protein